MGEVPALAKRRGISVTLGAWLDTDRVRNEREIEQAIRLAKEHSNVVRIMVGNEVLLRGDLARADLIAHLEHVRAATRQPVSTAEPWHVWILCPELAQHVDYIAVHVPPYWEGVEVEAAVGTL
jgi:exo-beta-1,3-glucanase (GH17 family)